MLSRARILVKKYREQQIQGSALYWASKAFTLSGESLDDLVVLVQTLYESKQYKRALHFLESSALLHCSSTLSYLAARCYIVCEEWEEVLKLLSPSEYSSSPLGQKRFSDDESAKSYEVISLGNLESAKCLLRAAAHEGLGDITSAKECYKQALLLDVFCEEALDKLCHCHSLSFKEERNLFHSMPFQKQCIGEEEELLKALYQCKLVHTRSSSLKDSSILPFSLRSLEKNLDVLCDVAGVYLDTMNIDSCYNRTSHILDIDPYHKQALLLHIVCCVCLSKVEELFILGNKLVLSCANSALAWYCVACYYISIHKHQIARRYLNKSISLDSTFAPSHLAFGISLAQEGERDQARAAFAAAARVMQGSHLPLMLLGREYYLTGAISTSTKFIKNALIISPHNPTLIHEVGVMLFNNGEYSKAGSYFNQCISTLRSIDPNVILAEWEPVYSNLGHVMRKQGEFEEALRLYGTALQLSPGVTSILTAIAFTYFLMGKMNKAVEFTNYSLRLKRDDQFTLEMLHLAVEEIDSSCSVELKNISRSNVSQ